jgi:hypothetical protein
VNARSDPDAVAEVVQHVVIGLTEISWIVDFMYGELNLALTDWSWSFIFSAYLPLDAPFHLPVRKGLQGPVLLSI